MFAQISGLCSIEVKCIKSQLSGMSYKMNAFKHNSLNNKNYRHLGTEQITC